MSEPRKKGGQPGNQNARKHGDYSRLCPSISARIAGATRKQPAGMVDIGGGLAGRPDLEYTEADEYIIGGLVAIFYALAELLSSSPTTEEAIFRLERLHSFLGAVLDGHWNE